MNERHKIDTIIAYICHAFMVGREEMLSRIRTRRVSWARHALCKILHEQYGLNDHEIGGHIGRDRTTAFASRNVASALYDTNEHFKRAYDEVIQRLTA